MGKLTFVTVALVYEYRANHKKEFVFVPLLQLI